MSTSSIIEKVEEAFGKKIPCLMQDEEGNNWAAHGMILGAYSDGYKAGQDDMSVELESKLKEYQNGSRSVAIIHRSK